MKMFFNLAGGLFWIWFGDGLVSFNEFSLVVQIFAFIPTLYFIYILSIKQ